MKVTADDVERFFSHTARRGDCLEWTGHRMRDGYGRLRIGSRTDGSRKLILAHRFAYYLATGMLPPVVRHACDNPPCVRAEHLIGGSHLDNMRDCAEKQRVAGRKLSPADVLIIRSLLAERRLTQSEIGALFGVSQKAISFIKRGINWKYL